MSKITLTNLVDLQNETTAVNAINNNNQTLTTAFDNTLSRDGTSPNQMGAAIDMNSNRVLNLPVPINGSEPLRLQDAATLNGGGTISSGLTSVGLVMPADFSVSGSPLISNGNITVTLANSATGTGGLVRATSPTIATPTITAPVMTTINNAGTLTLPVGPDTLVGRATTDTLTNKTINTAGTGNHIQISGVDITRGQILGEASTASATAGNIGEFVSSTVAVGSPVVLTTGTGANVTSISLTAGDWDVEGLACFNLAATTVMTQAGAGLNTTTGTFPTSPGGGSVSWVGSFTGPGVFLGPMLNTQTTRFSLSSTTTIFLVAFAVFTTSTASVYGLLRARRVR